MSLEVWFAVGALFLVLWAGFAARRGGALRSRADTAATPNRQPHVDEFDAGPVLAQGLDLLAEIAYRDRDGAPTKRRITVRRLHGSEDPEYGNTGWIFVRYAYAWCHERQDYRHFAVSRIESLTDLSTGEVIDTGTRDIAAWFRSRAGIKQKNELNSPDVVKWLPKNQQTSYGKEYRDELVNGIAILKDNISIHVLIKHSFDMLVNVSAMDWEDIQIIEILGDKKNGWPQIARIIANSNNSMDKRIFYMTGLLSLKDPVSNEEIQQAEGWLLWRAGLLDAPPRVIPNGRSSTRRPNPPLQAVVERPRTPDHIETYEVDIIEVELMGGVPVAFSGRAKRMKTEHDRAWTGHKRFTLQGYDPDNQPIIALRPSPQAEAVSDAAAWIAEQTAPRSRRAT
jgi:hypothetical protein